MEPTTTPVEDCLPIDIRNWLNTFAPNVREWLQAQLVALSQITRQIDAFRTRLDAVEGSFEYILQAGPGMNKASHAQTIEPIPLATIVERLDRLEHTVATLGSIEPMSPTSEHNAPMRDQQLSTLATRTRSVSQPISTTTADGIRLELLRARRGGNTSFNAAQQRLMKTHALTKGQMNAIWARCQGKFRPDFVGRIMRNTPPEHRIELRNELVGIYAVPTDDIIAWSHARNGNGVSSPPQPRLARRRIVRLPDTKKK